MSLTLDNFKFLWYLCRIVTQDDTMKGDNHMLLAIQFMGVLLILAALLAGAGWWHLALSWYRGSASPVARQSRWVIICNRDGFYFGREYKYAYAWA
jgi:hypothetical protein